MTITGHIVRLVTRDEEPEADRLERNKAGRALHERYHDRIFVQADPGVDLRNVDGKHRNGRGELVVMTQRQAVGDGSFRVGALELEGLELGGLVRLELSEEPDPLERVLTLRRAKA